MCSSHVLGSSQLSPSSCPSILSDPSSAEKTKLSYLPDLLSIDFKKQTKKKKNGKLTALNTHGKEYSLHKRKKNREEQELLLALESTASEKWQSFKLHVWKSSSLEAENGKLIFKSLV